MRRHDALSAHEHEEGRVMDDRDDGLRQLGILICVLAICGAAAGIVTAILWWVTP